MLSRQLSGVFPHSVFERTVRKIGCFPKTTPCYGKCKSCRFSAQTDVRILAAHERDVRGRVPTP